MIIQKGTYWGYLWHSDKTDPEVLMGNNIANDITLDNDCNPFIIEGQLFDKDNRKSYSIKYVDGNYIIKEYIVSEEELNDENNCLKFLPNRMHSDLKSDNGLRLRFLQRWSSKEDPNCDNMEVLCPAELVFIGFNI